MSPIFSILHVKMIISDTNKGQVRRHVEKSLEEGAKRLWKYKENPQHKPSRWKGRDISITLLLIASAKLQPGDSNTGLLISYPYLISCYVLEP
jgi:hypothetical protein